MAKTVVNKNEKKFQQIEGNSVAALSQFYKIVDQLSSDNEALEKLHGEVDVEMKRLADVKSSITERIAKNDHTIAGIQKVLGN